MFTIVVAWIKSDGIEITDEYYRFDGVNYKRRARVVPKPRAMCWLLEGDEADLVKAQEYAETKREEAECLAVEVYTMPTNAPDPLEDARQRIMADYEAKNRE